MFPARAVLVLVSVALAAPGGAARAGEADVTAVEVEQTAPGVYGFRVTVALPR